MNIEIKQTETIIKFLNYIIEEASYCQLELVNKNSPYYDKNKLIRFMSQMRTETGFSLMIDHALTILEIATCDGNLLQISKIFKKVKNDSIFSISVENENGTILQLKESDKNEILKKIGIITIFRKAPIKKHKRMRRFL